MYHYQIRQDPLQTAPVILAPLHLQDITKDIPHEIHERRKSVDDSHKKHRSAKPVSCKTCGKSYRNQQCLQKHSWEHHSSWPLVQQMLPNKHQCVQVMEAAQILVNLSDPLQKIDAFSDQSSNSSFGSI